MDGIQAAPDGVPNDAGNADNTGPTVADAIAAAMARMTELQADTFGPGSTIGDVMATPVLPVAGDLPDSVT